MPQKLGACCCKTTIEIPASGPDNVGNDDCGSNDGDKNLTLPVNCNACGNLTFYS